MSLAGRLRVRGRKSLAEVRTVLRVDKWSICEVDFAGSRDAGFILELGNLHVH